MSMNDWSPIGPHEYVADCECHECTLTTNRALRARIAELEAQAAQFQLIGFTTPSYVEEWLATRDPAHLLLMAYHGNHRVAVFTLKDGVELAWRGESPPFEGTMVEPQVGDVIRRPNVPTLPVAVAVEAPQQRDWLPEFDPSRQRTEQGLYRKFSVERVDGSDLPGGKHHGCEYFVLDLMHDQFAAPALRAYASACREQYPQLAADLEARYGTAPQPAEVGADEREKFEAWASPDNFVIDRTPEGAYEFTATRLAWSAWQARAQLTEGADALAKCQRTLKATEAALEKVNRIAAGHLATFEKCCSLEKQIAALPAAGGREGLVRDCQHAIDCLYQEFMDEMPHDSRRAVEELLLRVEKHLAAPQPAQEVQP